MDLLKLIAQKKASMNASKRQKTIKPADGRSRYRILPSWKPEAESDGAFWHDFGQHFIKDMAGDLKVVYVCTDATYGKPCEICGGIEHGIRASTDDVMNKVLKDAKASKRILLNVLHIDGETPEEPQILECAPTVFNEICGIIQEWGADVIDLEKGKDVIIERSGKGLQTKYSVQVAAKSKAVNPSVMKKVANLDEYVAQESEEQSRRALANLSAIAGALPAPTARPSLRDMSVDEDDEALRSVEIASSAEMKKAETAKVAKPVVIEAEATTGDDDLDNLLAAIGME